MKKYFLLIVSFSLNSAEAPKNSLACDEEIEQCFIEDDAHLLQPLLERDTVRYEETASEMIILEEPDSPMLKTTNPPEERARLLRLIKERRIITQIKAGVLAGKKCREIAAELKISPRTMSRYTRKAGLQLAHTKVAPEMINQIEAGVFARKTHRQIAHELGIDRTTVTKHVHKLNAAVPATPITSSGAAHILSALRLTQ